MNDDNKKYNYFPSQAKALIILICLLLSFFLTYCGVEHKNIFLGLFSIVIAWQTGVLSFIYITDGARCSNTTKHDENVNNDLDNIE